MAGMDLGMDISAPILQELSAFRASWSAWFRKALRFLSDMDDMIIKAFRTPIPGDQYVLRLLLVQQEEIVLPPKDDQR